ncbi:hypothetical protein Bca4012_057159 [Brassica carinata]|uniref:Uncharacterized protein n=1 Tax=Brassica carinata TaxID=52824 RepID=A0A8X8B304_BRACI|nr:hypothetical protein Bca52824_015242 [Brassica carinata]
MKKNKNQRIGFKCGLGFFAKISLFSSSTLSSSSDLESKMAMRRVYSKIKGKKVKERRSHIKSSFSTQFVKTYVKRGLNNYNDKYIQTSSVQPLLHFCFGGMAFYYLVALPNERCSSK